MMTDEVKLMEVIDIPNLLHFSKYLVKCGYLSKSDAGKLLIDCELRVESNKDIGHERAQAAIIDFSSWLKKVS